MTVQNENADFVVSAVRSHVEALAAALVQCEETLPAEGRLGQPAIAAVVTWLGDILDARNQSLRAAEQVYINEQADDPAARREREAATAAAVSVALQGRSRIENVFGGAVLIDYGLRQPPPRSPSALAEYLGSAIELLRRSPRSDTDVFGASFSVAQVADAFAGALARLQGSLAAVLNEKREFEAALVRRNDARDALTDGYQGVADALTGLFRLGALKELAERVRPTSRRVRGQERIADVAAGTTEDANAAAPGADADAA